MKLTFILIALLALCGCSQKSADPHFVLSYGNSPDVKITVDGQLIAIANNYNGRLLNIDDLIKHDPFIITFEITPNDSMYGRYAFGLTRFDQNQSKIIFEEQIKLPLTELYKKSWTIKK